jgi:hypothetical protein
MADFPTGFPLPNDMPFEFCDNAIMAEVDAGKDMSVKRFTTAQINYSPVWTNLDSASYDLWKLHYDTVETWGVFTFTLAGCVSFLARYYQPPAVQTPSAGKGYQLKLYIKKL